MSQHLKTSCILASCRKRIPMKRQRRNAITCSACHQKLLVKLRKQERDRKICQQCGRPSTPKDRQRWREWRSHEAQQRKAKKPAQNPILASAEAIKDIAYVCPPRSPKPKRAKPGKAAA